MESPTCDYEKKTKTEKAILRHWLFQASVISLLASLVLIYFISSWNITEKYQKIILQYGGRARGMFSWSLIYNINIKTWTA